MAPQRAAAKTVEPSIRKLLFSHSTTFGRRGLVYAQYPQLRRRSKKSGGWAAEQGASVLRSRELGTWSRPLSTRVTAPRFTRHLATVSNGENMSPQVSITQWESVLTQVAVNPSSTGPLEEYDERVHSHRLRDDEHQRGDSKTTPLSTLGH